MKIAIRTDASPQIGTGHVMRCLTLADALREAGAEVCFITRKSIGPLAEIIAAHGHAVSMLPAGSIEQEHPEDAGTAHAAWLPVHWRADALQTLECLQDMVETDWLIVDHYALDARWENLMRQSAKKIMVIDDLADRPHDCDLLLDQNLYPDLEHRYDDLIPENCHKLLGPKFVLLRPEFRAARAALRERDGIVRRILVFFGGADPTDETNKALSAVKLLNRPDIAIDVVVGATNPNQDLIRSKCASIPNCRFLCQVPNMAELMALADISIGAVGTATWERCFLGLPTLTWVLSNNQVMAAEFLHRLGVIECIGWYEYVDVKKIISSIQIWLSSPHALRKTSNLCFRLFELENTLDSVVKNIKGFSCA